MNGLGAGPGGIGGAVGGGPDLGGPPGGSPNPSADTGPFGRDPKLDAAAQDPAQTHMKIGKPHFSPNHPNEGPGTPVQQDLQLFSSTGKHLTDIKGTPPPGTVVQTTLNQFRR